MWVRVGALVFAAAAAALASRRRAAAERKHLREQEELERKEEEETEREEREEREVREEREREWERERQEKEERERVKEEEEEKNRLYQYLSSLLPPPLSPPGHPPLPPRTIDTKPTSPSPPVLLPTPQPLNPPYTLLPPPPSPPPRHPTPPPFHPASPNSHPSSPPPLPQPSPPPRLHPSSPPLHRSSPPPLRSLPSSPLPSLPSLPPLLPPEQQLSFLQREPKHNISNNNHYTLPPPPQQQSPPQLRFFNDEQEVSGPFSPPPEPETSSSLQPKQLTFDASNHCLDNNDNFSPDGRFLVYDTRPDDAHIANCTTIEQVEIATQKITILYRAPNPVPDAGPGVGAVSYHPIDNKIVFIHGPHATGRGGTRYKYAKTHRFGMLMSTETPGVAANIDARDVVPSFTPGAHRGGTHRHEFDGSSQWIGWTYNDAYMATLGQDLRTIGVTKLGQQVRVPDGPGNRSGLGFSAIVVKVVPNPALGSDEISEATEDSWVGFNGYIVGDADGTHFRRQRARAFIGSTRSSMGDVLREVYIVDIPDDITRPSSIHGPMQGTMEGMPGPPMGCRQRRISFTEHKPFPGCRGIVRSHPKGHWVSFLARSDDDGTWQVFLVRPQPGMWTPHQLSHVPGGLLHAPRWLPSGKAVIAIDTEHRLVSICAVRSSPRYGLHSPLTPSSPSSTPLYAHCVSRDGSMIAYNKDVAGVDGVRRRQIYIVPYDEGEDGLPNSSVAGEEGEYVPREESQGSRLGFSPSVSEFEFN